MNIVNEKSTAPVQEIKIEIEKGDYFEKIEEGLKKQRRKAVIPGFRPGNAPMGMIRKMYYKNLLADEINQMVGEALYGYLRDNNLEILMEPLPVNEKSKVDFDNGEDFVFTFEYALQPDFDLQLDQLPAVHSFTVKASEKEIDDYVGQLKKRHGQYTSPESVEFEDDYVTLQYENEEKTGYFHSGDLSEEGQALFEGKKTNDLLEIPLRKAFKDNASLARFLKMEEKDIDPENDYAYSFKISSIGRVEPAEINEEFFQKAFPDGKITDEKTMREFAASEIEKRWKEETDRYFMNEAIKVILDNVAIDMPDEFIKRYILATQNDITKESLDEKYDDYNKSFKWQLLENRLGKEYNLSVTQDDVKEYIRHFFMTNYFSQFNQEDIAERLDTLVNDALKNKEDVKRIYDTLFDKKIEEVLRSNMKVEEKTGDFQEFITFVSGEKMETTAPEAKKKATSAKTQQAGEGSSKPKTKKPEETEGGAKKKTTVKKNNKKEE